jgi:hypothetical protein
MPKQPVFPVLRNAMKKKQTRRRALFLSEMDAVVPWMRLMALITPHYPTGRAEGWTPANTAGDDATRLLPSELVCPERSDGRGDALHSERCAALPGSSWATTAFQTRRSSSTSATCWSVTGGVCQNSCPPISFGVSDLRGAGFVL